MVTMVSLSCRTLQLYFVSNGAVQVVDEHDQVVSVIRSDVPDTAPIVIVLLTL